MLFRIIITLSLIFAPLAGFGETSAPVKEPIRVVTLGTFHFHFPNLDAVKVSDDDKIDVLSADYQRQLEDICQQLMTFNPTHIVVEHRVTKQNELTKAYSNYLAGQPGLPAALPPGEVYQFGFRLAKKSGHKTLFAADTWGQMYPNIEAVFNDKTKVAEFGRFYKNNPDTSLRFDNGEPAYKSHNIATELLRLNDEQHLKQSLGNYLIGHFKFESEDNEYFGADFETGRWFNRNLRIFRNIQRVPAAPATGFWLSLAQAT
ncbi:hypothetical protein IT774_03325 [Salinimonas marina]|uniref:Uncharacterized protein n=1 Tax=Salinimonas marina TaxID=2785918 RepID=A0A7S9DYB8_9ALTE|nr:DUF5694 domain-containing protein [Salinimonas marina]QPG06252.1 hypothetical protein IT774_03325 [Salinimonas marina]